MRLRFLLVALAAASVLFSSLNGAMAGDWPNFLGPSGNGVSAETGLISKIPESGPEVLWRAAVGVGMSNVAVSGGLVYTLFQDDQHQFLIALNEATGEQQWKTAITVPFENPMGNGPRATPTIVEGTAFAFTGDGTLAAVSCSDGKLKWKVDVPASLNGKVADYGMASSPLVVDGLVVVHAGSSNGNTVAFDVSNGQRKWIADYGLSGYSSPVVMTLSGIKQIVSFVGQAVIGISINDGKQLWKYNFDTDYACNTASPVQLDESSLLISAGENHGSAILKITKSDDKIAVEEVWVSFGKESVLRAEWQTPVLVDGHLFALDNLGSAGPITNLVCINIADRKQLWSKDRFGKGNLTYADGKLFLSTMRGELVIVEADVSEFKETARAVVTGMTRQAPVIANGRLYLRDDKEVVCIRVKPPETATDNE